MSAKRGASGLSGVLLVDKPSGMTSHDVVSRVRRAAGERRVGHAGTLDPMATGLLVVLVGPATRLAPYMTAARKTYLATIVFGTQTDTDDAEGTVTATAPVPELVADEAFAAEKVAALVGVHEQVPPAFSAIKKDGRAAYELARKGEAVQLEPRSIEVVHSRLIDVRTDPVTEWDVEVTVSKGTYVRALARDLAREMETAGHLGALRRTVSGTYSVEDALTLEQIDAAGPQGVAQLFADPIAGLGMSTAQVTDDGAKRVGVGARLSGSDFVSGALPSETVAVTRSGRLLAVYAWEGSDMKAVVVIPDGVAGGSS